MTQDTAERVKRVMVGVSKQYDERSTNALIMWGVGMMHEPLKEQIKDDMTDDQIREVILQIGDTF